MDQPSAARCAWYSAALSNPGALPAGLMRMIQPAPYGSELISSGWLLKRGVAFDDGARDRRVHIGGGLHGLDDGEGCRRP